MKIFVLHYSKLIERKKFIINQFEKNNIIDYEFVENEPTEDELKLFDFNANKYDLSNLNLNEVSLSVKHHYAFRQIAEKYDNALIFEDDVLLCNDFISILNKYLNVLPDDYDMFFISDGLGLHIDPSKIVPNKIIYEKDLYRSIPEGHGCTRCTDSIIMSKKCAINLCKLIDNPPCKIFLAIDYWLNVVALFYYLKVYWAEPTFVKQGSKYLRLFNTSIKS
jgi:GR25 family glycosyltransferase involved in LPS biosynthesis